MPLPVPVYSLDSPDEKLTCDVPPSAGSAGHDPCNGLHVENVCANVVAVKRREIVVEAVESLMFEGLGKGIWDA